MAWLGENYLALQSKSFENGVTKELRVLYACHFERFVSNCKLSMLRSRRIALLQMRDHCNKKLEFGVKYGASLQKFNV